MKSFKLNIYTTSDIYISSERIYTTYDCTRKYCCEDMAKTLALLLNVPTAKTM